MQGQWDQVVAVRRQMVREAPGDAGVRANFALLLDASARSRLNSRPARPIGS